VPERPAGASAGEGVVSGRSKRIVATGIVLAGVTAIAGIVVFRGRSPGSRVVRTTGTVEAVETNIASKIAGRIVSLTFREGDAVREGDLLVELDSRELLAASRHAEASVKVAKAALASGHDTVANNEAEMAVAKADLERARADVARAEAALVRAEKDFERVRDLFRQGVDPQANLDAAQADRDMKAAEQESARSALAAAEARLTAAAAALKKARGDITTLEAKVAEAEAVAAEAGARLAETRILSPANAVVEYRAREPGEVVSPGESILTLVDLDSLWVRFDLEQSYIESVRIGQRADVTLERRPDRVFEGRVLDIGREGEFAVERDVTRGRQDIRTFRTRVQVDDPSGILKPGMTVLVTIPIEGEADRR
jgi:HlyD family secretion protein